MIKILSISITEFRGIRDLTLPMNAKSFAVCGSNGTGKSGVVDAIQFALTGNISRLSGRGSAVVSVKEHAPHVDSQSNPERAQVTLTVSIPSLGQEVTITRSVKNASTPTISSSDSAVLEVFKYLEEHPEFVLSRRELINYILATPGERATEVQELLRLDPIEDMRLILQRIANSSNRETKPLKQNKKLAADKLATVLETPKLDSGSILSAANEKRALLGLEPITTLTSTTSLKDGLSTNPQTTTSSLILKPVALEDLSKFRGQHTSPPCVPTAMNLDAAILAVGELDTQPHFADNVSRKSLLETALELFEGDQCPVCNTPWTLEDFSKHVSERLEQLANVTKKKNELEAILEPIVNFCGSEISAIKQIKGLAQKLTPIIETPKLDSYEGLLTTTATAIGTITPLVNLKEALEKLRDLPCEILSELAAIEDGVKKLPEPSKQEEAREYLIMAQERLETYRSADLQLDKAEKKYEISKNISEIYNTTSTEILEGIYDQVESEFTEHYRFINDDDEASFDAELIPSTGKLGFNVDFYGRGYFPPGAYHSEGHQDGMGICLYLALMKHLLGKSFSFAVLDDVLMSVDTGHRRKVCDLLMKIFPDTQFILTTHDKVWFKQMKTNGLIETNQSIHFSEWNVDDGPKVWEESEVWTEIRNRINKDDVPSAAGLLRRYLEHVAAEFCDALRAPVEFKIDNGYMLGDLMPRATEQLRKVLKAAQASAVSWEKPQQEQTDLETQLNAFEEAVTKSQCENWAINAAVHYNEWANLDKADMAPVVDAMEQLEKQFKCSSCNSLFYVQPEFGSKETLRCRCKAINLLKKPSE